jgi:CRISPR-associated exonuclease Cas4
MFRYIPYAIYVLGVGGLLVSPKDMRWMRNLEGRELPISDISEPSISVTDVKHYFYCPRIIYFERVLHAKPQLGSQQEASIEQHKEYVKREDRRKDAIYYSPDFTKADKIFFAQLHSSKLKLSGTVDLIIRTKDGEYIPADYKNMPSNHGRIWLDHKYQLTAYALLIDEVFNTHVKRGFVNYIPEEKVIELEITYSMKVYVKKVLGDIERIIKDEKLPPIRTDRKKCMGGCGFKFLCLE